MTRLARLEARARREIALTMHPRADWMPSFSSPDGQAVHNVLIVGAGQGGSALALQLQRDRVPGVMVVDRSPRGLEGPWLTYARMPTLRSPKDYTGPDLGIPSLTYEAWHGARYGDTAWRRLKLIRTEDWAAYLLWVREVSGIEVRNDTELVSIEPIEAAAQRPWKAMFRVALAHEGHRESHLFRKIVLASGQDGAGCWWLPRYLAELPTQYRAHTAEAIDFAALSGKTIAVLGAGAAAADNAAMALEHGADAVHMFVRRERMQRVQPYRWLTFKGFLRHLRDLDDRWRWRFMQHILAMRESIPQDTYDRMRRHDNFHIHVSHGWTGVELTGGRHPLSIETTQGRYQADFIIAGTGVDIDFHLKPELAGFARHIKTWAAAYQPPPEEANERLARYPYLDPYGAYMERETGLAPYLSSIFDFTIAATMSLGPSGSSINAMTTAVPLLAAGVTRSLFREDVEEHWRDFLTYDVPVFVPTDPDEGK